MPHNVIIDVCVEQKSLLKEPSETKMMLTLTVLMH